MPDSTILLLTTAVSLGFVHTVLGPDHYLPFVMMARAQEWTRRKMLTVTVLSGVGHVASSVVLGAAGILLGTMVEDLIHIESLRGDIAAWALIAFGLVYGVWGLRRARHAHVHTHRHEDGTVHAHAHSHAHTIRVEGQQQHASVSDAGLGHPENEGSRHAHPHTSMTVWSLFLIFVLGPCEPLIPLLMYPAAAHHGALVASVALAFGITTIGTMVVMTLVLDRGISVVSLPHLERYTHALAGGMILCTGLAIVFLGI